AISKSSFREMVVVSVDAMGGLVRTKGWVEKTDVTAADLVQEAARFGITTVNYTDISKDGMLEGPNIAGLKGLLSMAMLDIIAAGGITTIEDVRKLKALEKDGLKGIIIGKALYEGKIDLAEAVKICSLKE
ncbi:MAG: HisA/HisF-related TIM barrel protein, partial [Candidatus Omnitrophota bacterium]|nr:HisA/HisF-related TIM barrel protein [Candidatus Omnitrophota bacterium]